MELLITVRPQVISPALDRAEACARQLLADVGNPDAEVSLLLTDDTEIHTLNQQWRGKDKPTDVLSWPQEDPVTLGDVAISLDTATRQAVARGWGVEEELALLLVHGILHLLGHEDDTEAGSEAMKVIERRILGKPLDPLNVEILT